MTGVNASDCSARPLPSALRHTLFCRPSDAAAFVDFGAWAIANA